MLDLTRYVRPGDTVVWGQACAEPLTLTAALMRQRAEIGGFRCFLGIPASDTVRAEHADHISFVSYCGTGANRALHRAGVLDIVPCHYSALPGLLSTGPLRADVVLLSLPPADPDGRYRVGVAADYVWAAIRTARVVLAEVNDQLPRVGGPHRLAPEDLTAVIRTSHPPATLDPPPAGPLTDRIAGHVASLVEDGATVQLGIGALPAAVLGRLADRSDLGVHSGQIGDAVADLMAAGVITNRCKTVDRGRTVAGLLMGSRKLLDFADGNASIELRETAHTHGPDVLAAQDRLVAVNSAVEVDLTGQANAEVASGEYVGAVGGAADFLRGAARSRGGLPVVALPANRIVARLSGPVSTSRADAGLVVTEYGVADLRGQPLRARRERLLAVAHPDHQQELESA